MNRSRIRQVITELWLGLAAVGCCAAGWSAPGGVARNLPPSQSDHAAKGVQRLSLLQLQQAQDAARPKARPVDLVLNATPLPEEPGVETKLVAPRSENEPRRLDGNPLVAPKHASNKRLFSFRAENLDLKSALALFARANGLNVVPDNDVVGTVTLDVRDLPLERMMQALLQANDYHWQEEDGLIRITAAQTRDYTVDYLRLSRKGTGNNSVVLASGSSGSSGGGGGGGGGGGSGGGGGGQGSSSINLTADTSVDFWKELKEEVGKMLTVTGRESIAYNMTAGIIQVTDRPSALKRVEHYLEKVGKTVTRQVDLQARIYDVTLNDQFQFGIDWDQAIKMYGGQMNIVASPIVQSAMGAQSVKSDTFSMLFRNENTKVLLKALQEQGTVHVVSQPHIRSLNNQTAMIKVGTELPFFSSQTSYLPGTSSGTTTQISDDTVTTITVGTILAITPQISSDDFISLDISPVLTSLVGQELSPTKTTTAPILDVKQASALVRVPDGYTVVMGGLMYDEKAKTVRKVPIIGDIPLFGLLFQGHFDFKQKKELVISITPTIVR